MQGVNSSLFRTIDELQNWCEHCGGHAENSNTNKILQCTAIAMVLLHCDTGTHLL